MTLTLDANLRPKAVNLAGNSVPFVLSTDNLYLQEGAKGVVDLEPAYIPVNQDKFTISWNGGLQSFEFLFVATPDDSGLQIQNGSTYSGNMQNWLDFAFIPAMQSHPVVSSVFTIARESTNKVRFTAKYYGNEYELTFTGESQAGTPVSWPSTTITSPENRIKQTNFKVVALLNVRQAGATDYTEISLALDPVGNVAAFDLGPVLEGDWYAEPLPSHNLNAPVAFTNCVAEFFVRYTEEYGSTPVMKKLVQSNIYRSLMGQLSYNDARSQHVLTNFISENKFLNRLPQNARIHSDQRHLLWWYAFGESATDADVYVSLVYEDGTTSGGAVKLFDISGVADHKLFCIPVTIALVAAVADPKPLYSFEIWVSANGVSGTQYTEKRKFFRASDPKSDSLDIAFANSFGVYEIFRCTGIQQEGIDVQHEFARVPRDPQSTAPLSRHIRASVDQFTEVSTGYLNQGEALQLAELLASRSTYVKTASGWNKVRIEQGGMKLKETRGGELYSTTLKLFADITDESASHA